MKSVFTLVGLLLLGLGSLNAQKMKKGIWQGNLLREDGQHIVFLFDVSYRQQQPVIHIHNADERLEVKQVKLNGDSVFIEMPFFESSFALQLQPDGSLKGKWIKATSRKIQEMPFVATPGVTDRFPAGQPATANLNGKWELTFTSKSGNSQPAIAEFEQKRNKLTGSISLATGDYRYLEGIVKGDSLFLSTFDGSHAYVFKAKLSAAGQIENGVFYSGPVYAERFSGKRNENAKLSMDEVAIQLKPGEERLDFRFPDLDGNLVGIGDDRFRNKVVVIQIMGSWCPNCMDETAFLSNYYKKNKDRGIEMLALAYEYSLDTERSKKSLKKFQQRFNVDYPILLTGVTSSDTLRTEKTLPQITPIKSFPSTIFIGRDGKVKKVHGGFFGPATGDLYTQYTREFNETVEALLVQ